MGLLGSVQLELQVLLECRVLVGLLAFKDQLELLVLGHLVQQGFKELLEL
jgi:hypothetical protein